MGFRINTNIGAMNAHSAATMNNRELDNSLSRLSSGLRINKAADDASGMTIADNLRAQSKGLGQAIANANDGIAVTQTADGALDEYTNIIQTVRTKSIQAASDGQNADSRAAIQRDITKLLEEAQNIAKTTSFNGQKLLDGNFTNKSFQIGAYAGETVGVSIGNVQTKSIGGIASVNNDASNATADSATWTTLAAANFSETASGNVLKTNELTINGIDISASLNKLSPTRLQDASTLAAAITDATGLIAQGSTKLTGAAIAGGAVGATDTLKINGIAIDVAGKTLTASDSDGVLTRAINEVSNQTGVTASVVGGKLVLEAADGRNIAISGNTATAATAAGLTRNATSATSTANGTLEVADTAAVTLTEGQLIINGKDMAGSYGDGATAGSAADALEAAIKNMKGFEDSTVSDTGVITLSVNDGQDLNIAGSSTYGLTEGITNTSEHGVVNIFSNEKVTIAGTDPASFGFTAGGYTPKTSGTSLDSIDVNTRTGAQVSILIADAALKQVNTVRSNLGSVQNQLESTIRNISVTQVNVSSAESQIRDVDFAAESANFSKRNILAQSGSYAMSQANAVQQNVLRLLQ